MPCHIAFAKHENFSHSIFFFFFYSVLFCERYPSLSGFRFSLTIINACLLMDYTPIPVCLCSRSRYTLHSSPSKQEQNIHIFGWLIFREPKCLVAVCVCGACNAPKTIFLYIYCSYSISISVCASVSDSQRIYSWYVYKMWSHIDKSFSFLLPCISPSSPPSSTPNVAKIPKASIRECGTHRLFGSFACVSCGDAKVSD